MYYDILLLGIVMGLIYSELTGYSSAGMVTAGYFTIYLKTPERIVTTLVLAAVTHLLCKLLSRAVVLYGRRSFAAAVAVSSLLSYLFTRRLILPFPVAGVGYIIPALVARDFETQGILRTLLSLGVVVGLTACILLLLGHPILG